MSSGNIGENIRFFREIRGYSQQGLADSIGVSQKMISRIENELSSPTFDIIEKIAEELEVEILILMKTRKAEILQNLIEERMTSKTENSGEHDLHQLYKELLKEKERYIQFLEKELKWLRSS